MNEAAGKRPVEVDLSKRSIPVLRRRTRRGMVHPKRRVVCRVAQHPSAAAPTPFQPIQIQYKNQPKPQTPNPEPTDHRCPRALKPHQPNINLIARLIRLTDTYKPTRGPQGRRRSATPSRPALHGAVREAGGLLERPPSSPENEPAPPI